jgi:hypothetical protein
MVAHHESRSVRLGENNHQLRRQLGNPIVSLGSVAVQKSVEQPRKPIRIGNTNMAAVTLSTTFFWAASLISLVGFCIHTIAGQRLVMMPLMENEHLELQQKWFHFVAWHGVSISFAAYTAAFAYAALIPSGLDVAILMTAMNAAITLMFIGVGLKGDPMVFKFPGIYLALGTTALGGAGVLLS